MISSPSQPSAERSRDGDGGFDRLTRFLAARLSRQEQQASPPRRRSTVDDRSSSKTWIARTERASGHACQVATDWRRMAMNCVRPMLLVSIIIAAGLVLSSAPVPSARADEAAHDLTVAHLEAGTLAEGEAALAALADEDPTNADARLGLGAIRFLRAIENLSQGLYRYGLKPPESFMVPALRLPVPPNPDPQPITYLDFRALIQAYVDDLARAEETLAGVEASDVKLVLDLKQIRYDVDGDGAVADGERFLAVVQRVSGLPERRMPPSLTFAFDTGDVYWLRAYCHALMAFGEFFLAHDWQESFDASFFHLFPAMESPFRDALTPPGDEMTDQIAPIADFVSFLHIRWPVSEPARLAAVRTHLKRTIALSRESWEAIEAEVDDDREWLPNATQTSPFATLQMDAERIAAWRQVLDEAEAVLDGEKLVPHWRFDQGFNLRRVFEEPRPFDLVLWITGPAALPYLEDGPVTTPEDWARMTEAFGGRFGLFAIWIN